MASILSAVVLFFLAVLLSTINAQQCVTLPPSSVCSSILPYSSVSLNTAFSCVSDAEYALQQSPALIALLFEAAPNTGCAPAVASLLCQNIYQPCASNSTVSLPCSKTCTTFENACPAEAQEQLIGPFLSSLPTPLQLPALSDCGSSAYDTSSSCVSPPLPAASSFNGTPSCLAYSGTVCQGIVNYPVYIPASTSIRAIEAELAGGLSSVLLVAPVASGCRDALLKQMCSLAFLPCDAGVVQRATGLPYTYPFPRLPCASACQETQSTCSGFLHQFPQLAAATSCNTSNLQPAYQTCSGFTVPSRPDYPLSTTTFATLTLSNTTIPLSTTCYAPPSNMTASVSCPAPLVATAAAGDAVLGGSCGVPYKSMLWSADEWVIGDRLMVAFSILSFISLSIIMLTWTIFPIKRRQHHLHMFMCCQFIISLVFIISLAATNMKPSTIGLSYSTAPHISDTSVCIFQAAMLVFIVNAGVFWWTFIAFHLFLKIVLRYRLTTQHNNALTVAYHAVSWGVSLLLTLIGGVSGWYGRSSVVPWCFYKDASPASADWLLFYIPIGVRGVVGCVLMAAVMWGLWKQGRLVSGMRRSGSASGKANSGGRRALSCCNSMRPLMFIFQFFIIFFFLIVFRAILHFRQPAYTDSTVQFVTCLLTSADPTGSCGTRPALGPSVALFYLIIITTAGQGLVPGLIYLSQSSVWGLWRALVTGQGVEGVSRTRGGIDSSLRTESRAGGLSVNAMARRMSSKGLTGVGVAGDRAKVVGYGRKGSVSGFNGNSVGSGTTVQASPLSRPITLTADEERFAGDRSASPSPPATTIETTYAGLRTSRSASSGPPPLALNPHWYNSAIDSSSQPQPDWSVQLASITPAMYNSLPTPLTRSTFTSIPHGRPTPPIPPFELLALPMVPDEMARSVQLVGTGGSGGGHGGVVADGCGAGDGGGVEMAEVRRDSGSVRMELPVESAPGDVAEGEEEYRVTLHVDE